MSLTCTESFDQAVDQALRDAFRETPVIDIQELKAQTLEMVVNLNALMRQQCQRIPCERHGQVACMCHLHFQNACCALYKAAEDVLTFIRARDLCQTNTDAFGVASPDFDDVPLFDIDNPEDVVCPCCGTGHPGTFLCQPCSIQFQAFL